MFHTGASPLTVFGRVTLIVFAVLIVGFGGAKLALDYQSTLDSEQEETASEDSATSGSEETSTETALSNEQIAAEVIDQLDLGMWGFPITIYGQDRASFNMSYPFDLAEKIGKGAHFVYKVDDTWHDIDAGQSALACTELEDVPEQYRPICVSDYNGGYPPYTMKYDDGNGGNANYLSSDAVTLDRESYFSASDWETYTVKIMPANTWTVKFSYPETYTLTDKVPAVWSSVNDKLTIKNGTSTLDFHVNPDGFGPIFPDIEYAMDYNEGKLQFTKTSKSDEYTADGNTVARGNLTIGQAKYLFLLTVEGSDNESLAEFEGILSTFTFEQ